ncbi:hypothetical protein F5X99DRAFT_94436 [Biscogniauxia marginata]|nr:hypothetical protein F5X99DRAFT_94436 [Biscogniauxia marginata]
MPRDLLEVEATLMEGDSPYREVGSDSRLPLSAQNLTNSWLSAPPVPPSTCCSPFGIPVSINTYVIQLVAYPIDLGRDLIFPDQEFHMMGVKFNLKPGKFNFKERCHQCCHVERKSGCNQSILITEINQLLLGCLRR